MRPLARGLLAFFVLSCAVSGFAGHSSRADALPGPSGEAKKWGMISGSWSTGNKQFFGTAYEAYDSNNRYSGASPTAPISRVWFTGGQGVLTEVYWPTIDTPQVRDSQIIATDGKDFFFEERRDSNTTVEWLALGVPAYKVTNTERGNRFVIERTVFTDPDRDVVLQSIKIRRNVPGLKFFILHHPQVGLTPMGNSARVSLGEAPGAGLFAWQGEQAQALLSSRPFKQVSAGFVGASDGYSDIHEHFRMINHYATATEGNVAVTGWLDLPEDAGTTEFTLALGFGSNVDAAYRSASTSLAQDQAAVLAKYVAQWQAYQNSVYDLGDASHDGGKLFRSSVAVLKSMEDKTYEGAFVASPTTPWGEHETDANAVPVINGSRAHLVGGYHVVWPRDLYQMATTFMAIHDSKSAVACLNFLRRVQLGPNDGEWNYSIRRRGRDGSFWQNTWVNGEPYWSGLQLDEVAFPVILAYRLWKDGAIRLEDYWDMVKRAADFVQGYGPWSLMERWEEIMGASPSTLSAEITALWVASELADQMHDPARAKVYRDTADSWSAKPGDNLEVWTFTQSGGLGGGRYFTRASGASSFEEKWNPNSEQTICLSNDAGCWREKDLIDGGFLELVRMGVRPARDPAVAESVPVMDATIRFDLPGIGPGFRRYNHDRYNRDDVDGRRTDGMLWPFLTGERGHYELERAIENGAGNGARDAAIAPYIETMEKMATASHLLPEQIWDVGPRAGQSTGSATPLGWTHGEYIKLLRSRTDHQVFDRLGAAVQGAGRTGH